MKSKTFTYQTNINITSSSQEEFLSDMAYLLSKVERNLFSDYCRGINIVSQKTNYLLEYKITARQFNAIRINLEGKIRSTLELQDDYINNAKSKIEQKTQELKKLAKIKNPSATICEKIKNKTLALLNVTKKLINLEKDKKEKKARICFGSKKLFKKQFNLEQNDYTSHEEWLSDWQSSRSSQFYLIGSKDETTGNQSCVTSINDDNTINLRVKVAPEFEQKYGKYVVLENIKLNYGSHEILAAIQNNITRQNLQKKSSQLIHGDAYRNYGQAINFRFLRKDHTWKVFITIEQPAPERISIKDSGAIGVDINVDHLAVSEVNNTGNLVNYFTVPLVTYGKSHEQIQALTGDAVKTVVNYAVQQNKPIIIERLDFATKKRKIKKAGAKKARMLSSFSYSAIVKMLDSRAFRFGIEVFAVNPAYSSVIGRVKFAKIYKISVHNAAALVIARRYYNFSERLPLCWENIPDNTGGRMILPQLEKIVGKHIWSSWAVVMKEVKTALAAQYQMFRQAMECSSALTGEILEDIPF